VQESLARKLRILRADKGITLDEAEKLTGVTRETIGALEHAQRGAHTRTLEKIAHGYDVSVEYLVSSEPALALGKAEAPKAGRSVADSAAEGEREAPGFVVYKVGYEEGESEEESRNTFEDALSVAMKTRASMDPGSTLVVRDDGKHVEVAVEVPVERQELKWWSAGNLVQDPTEALREAETRRRV
jgi:transcriptional regulator with XRE-family HTH domain